MHDMIIIGAGPYGISLAAHAKAQGLSYVLLGSPMHFWQRQMPQSMYIRTNPRYVDFSDPDGRFTIARFAKETGTPLASPLPRPVFVEYAFWFARQTEVSFTAELASLVRQDGRVWSVVTGTGSELTARNVIVATGIHPFVHTPEPLVSLPASLLSHTYGLVDYTPYRGRRTAIVGSGQSAWEAAALVHLEGGHAELLFRSDGPKYAEEDNVASGQRLIETAERFYKLPYASKKEHWQAPRRSSIAAFLKPFVDGKVPMTAQVHIVDAKATMDNRVSLALSNGETRIFDRVIAATGYRIDLDLVPFLPLSVLQSIAREPLSPRFPQLSESFESSLNGLYFAGPLASHSHGPAFGFVAGLRQACLSIVPSIAKLCGKADIGL